jgi:hypothetical protein
VGGIKMKLAFVTITEWRNMFSQREFITKVCYITEKSIEHSGIDSYNLEFISDTIPQAAKRLHEVVDSNSKIVFDCPVILKSEDEPVEYGHPSVSSLYIWQLKKEYVKINNS